MYIDNNWYGHKKILLNYLNLKYQSIFGSIQHGWILEDRVRKTNYGKRTLTLAPFLCWNKKIENIIKENNIQNVHAIGAPFLYLCDIKKEIIVNNKKNVGTFAFPFHSTLEEKIIFDHEGFIKKIEENFTPPYYVSLYNEDLTSDITSLYKNKNWKIISFGKRENTNFLEEFLLEILKFKTVVFSEVSTGFFYSMYLQKETKIIYSKKPNKEFFFFRDYKNNGFNKNEINKIFLKNYPFIDKDKYDKGKGLQLAKKELGFDNFKSHNDLRKILKIDNYFIKIFSLIFKFLVIIKSKIQ